MSSPVAKCGGRGPTQAPASCACRPAPYYNNMPPRQHGEHTKVEDQSAVDTGALCPRPMAPPESVSHAAGLGGGQEATTHPAALSGPILAAAKQGTHHLVAGYCSCQARYHSSSHWGMRAVRPSISSTQPCSAACPLPCRLSIGGCCTLKEHIQGIIASTLSPPAPPQQPSQCTTGVPENPNACLSLHTQRCSTVCQRCRPAAPTRSGGSRGLHRASLLARAVCRHHC
jgi:hypothetical protein